MIVREPLLFELLPSRRLLPFPRPLLRAVRCSASARGDVTGDFGGSARLTDALSASTCAVRSAALRPGGGASGVKYTNAPMATSTAVSRLKSVRLAMVGNPDQDEGEGEQVGDGGERVRARRRAFTLERVATRAPAVVARHPHEAVDADGHEHERVERGEDGQQPEVAGSLVEVARLADVRGDPRRHEGQHHDDPGADDRSVAERDPLVEVHVLAAGHAVDEPGRGREE